MSRRAKNVDATRLRIVEAAVSLHGTVGPAATTVSAVAEAADVTRTTVYRHFPHLESLFAACSAHWMSRLRTRPDPGEWAHLEEPEARLRGALRQLYAFYREGQDMLRHVQRDAEALPPSHAAAVREQQQSMVQLALAAWPARQRTKTRAALVGHAMGFDTWQSLCVHEGLGDEAAVRAMLRLACS
ncbi:MAG: TetR family transcriptional regulator [Propionibacteriales bacterium]|nr:TetR family transcriptional regulator [Propionibacteriales bacterium]